MKRLKRCEKCGGNGSYRARVLIPAGKGNFDTPMRTITCKSCQGTGMVELIGGWLEMKGIMIGIMQFLCGVVWMGGFIASLWFFHNVWWHILLIMVFFICTGLCLVALAETE